jgi:hypothetical protein
MVPVEIIQIPTKAIPSMQQRDKPLTIADFELFVYSDDPSIASFCRKELKKRYAQKIASLKKRLKYGHEIVNQAEADLEAFERKRANLK